MTTPQLTSRLRGGGCGVLVGALAVAAHGMAGGGVPRSAEIALLLLVSLATGAFAGGRALPTFARRADAGWVRAAGALIGGQWAGHYALTGTLDHHGGVLDVLHLPSAPMVVAHLLAAVVCAALILVAERLYLVASGVIRAVLTVARIDITHRAARWTENVDIVLGTRREGVRCPRAPPLSA
ncbi:hypothetical protein AB0I35_00855 [Nocardia sp. NPDC050378]|uniref:hypothetical protein n=1 Tax=Nocardia sp. NPDC050378 TaxID=3155400 RepID=UPI0033EA65AF